jgi:hypothetical protein
MKGKSAPHLQIDHTRFSAYLPVPKHVTQGPLSRDRMTVIRNPDTTIMDCVGVRHRFAGILCQSVIGEQNE